MHLPPRITAYRLAVGRFNSYPSTQLRNQFRLLTIFKEQLAKAAFDLGTMVSSVHEQQMFFETTKVFDNNRVDSNQGPYIRRVPRR
jgi:hypothetical protein